MASIMLGSEVEEEASLLPTVDLEGNEVLPPVLVRMCDAVFHRVVNKLVFWKRGRVLTRFHISENHVLISLLVSLAASLGAYGYWNYRQNLRLVLKLIDLYHSGTLEKVMHCNVLFAEDQELRLMNEFYKKEQIRIDEVEILVSAELRGFYEQCSRMIVELHNSCDHLLNGLMEIRVRKVEEASRIRQRRRVSVGRRGGRNAMNNRHDQGRVHGEQYHSSDEDSDHGHSSSDEDNEEVDELREFLDKIQEKMDELCTEECIEGRRQESVQTVLDQVPGEKAENIQLRKERLMRRKVNRRRRKQLEEKKEPSPAELAVLESDDEGMPFEMDKMNEKFYENNGFGVSDGIPLDDFRSSLFRAVAVSPPQSDTRNNNNNNQSGRRSSDLEQIEYESVLSNEQRRRAEEFLIALRESNLRMAEQAYWMKMGVYGLGFSLVALSLGSMAYDKYLDWSGHRNEPSDGSGSAMTTTKVITVSDFNEPTRLVLQ